MELKLSIITHAANSSDPSSHQPDAGLVRALKSYSAHLRTLKDDLSVEERSLEAKLRGYESAGGGMKDIAGRYSELVAERQEVKEEIERLREAD